MVYQSHKSDTCNLTLRLAFKQITKSYKLSLIMESLILAQDERWQCALDMQVERSVFGACFRNT